MKLKKIKSKYRLTTLILSVFLFFIFNGMEFLHHHSEHHNAENCKVCSLSAALSNTFVSLKSTIHIDDTFVYLGTETRLHLISFYSDNSNPERAPPIFKS